ncbi:hypothetical protein FH972_001646 [Carpinus fangiana]|uniref:Rhodopsin domain-containing protein n=1 Tax=Carpinus fangiana TaxID=176857 RepID=A0A5N6QFP0_9ROSI|nr:hypothetical protein FH972_001646 [Carpinus fangiana]
MTDLLVALLPTILFWRLAIPRSQKIVLGAIFAVGFFLCAVGIVRCATLFYVFSGFDYIRTTNRLCSWTVTQALVGCMVASAPAFKVFFVRVVPSTRSRALSDEDASVDATLEKGNDRGREQSHGGRLQRKSVVDQGGRGTFRELDTGPGAERYELGNTDGRPHSALLVPPEPSLGEIVDPRMSGVTFGRRYDDAASMQRIQQERHYPSYNFI